MKKNQKNNGMSKSQKAVNKLRKEGFLNKPKGSEGRGMPVLIDKDFHDRISALVEHVGNGMTVQQYIDNVLANHCALYGKEIDRKIEESGVKLVYVSSEAYDMLAELAPQSSNDGTVCFCVDGILREHLAQYKETIGNEFKNRGIACPEIEKL